MIERTLEVRLAMCVLRHCVIPGRWFKNLALRILNMTNAWDWHFIRLICAFHVLHQRTELATVELLLQNCVDLDVLLLHLRRYTALFAQDPRRCGNAVAIGVPVDDIF